MRGQALGPYVILEQLATGGMAGVYAASHTRLGAQVAIKILHPHYQQDDELRARFLDEARILANLRHPNILMVQDIIEEADATGIVMELMEGSSVGQYYEKQGKPLPLGNVLWLFGKVADALAFAHSRGVVHRDLKPSNVFLRCMHGKVTPVLMDFGIAKFRGLGSRGQWTTLGAALGTPQFMAPEQFEDSSTVDGRADIFALGVMVYQACTGVLPFDSRSPAEVMKAIFHDTPQRPSAVRPGIPAILDDVIFACIEKDRTLRFPSAERLSAALRNAAASIGEQAIRASRVPRRLEDEAEPATEAVSYPSPPETEGSSYPLSPESSDAYPGPLEEGPAHGAPENTQPAPDVSDRVRVDMDGHREITDEDLSTASFQEAEAQDETSAPGETFYPLEGYTIEERVHLGRDTVVYRGFRNQDGKRVIIKAALAEYPSPTVLEALRCEFRILEGLALQGVMRVIELLPYRNGLALVSEDFGGKPLKLFVTSPRYKPRLQDALELTSKVSAALARLHERGIIHRDINPMNIVLNAATGEVRIIDFGQATISRGAQSSMVDGSIEGTPAYMAPEQTGRVSRPVDHRTDFYSLGVSMYEMLTGSLPFPGTDRNELIHAHVARLPMPPQHVAPDVPPAIGHLVMRLMAKNAEERYQSDDGLLSDVEECLRQLRRTGRVRDFALGRHDVSERFHVPQRLYGRESELSVLNEAFRYVSCGARRLVLVSGYPGIGKTSLVRELAAPVTRAQGYFVSGKFDQYRREVPYVAFMEAFRDLVHEVLTESELTLMRWRERLVAALGNTARVITDVIPEVEMIIGHPPPVPELPPAEALNRLRLTMQRFVSVFARSEHPLVIFLDDVQWADAASLSLFQLLLSSATAESLLLVAAFRDNEVGDSHPLSVAVKLLREQQTDVTAVRVLPLCATDVAGLVADALKSGPQVVAPLSEILYAKTEGNPFFLGEMLRTLRARGLIYFDRTAKEWRFSLNEIRAADVSDDLVGLMSAKIERLQPATRQAVKVGACVGSRFDIATVAAISGKPVSEVASALGEAVSEGILVLLGQAGGQQDMVPGAAPTSRSDAVLPTVVRYKFSHDKIQQAAYQMVAEGDRVAVHRQIGTHLLRETAPADRAHRVFEIANQLNAGGAACLDDASRRELASLNLAAGRRATATAAHDSAMKYYATGLDLLGDGAWNGGRDLAFPLHLEAAEASYMCNRLDEMERLLAVVTERARDLSERVRAYEIQIRGYIAQARKTEAVALALSTLSLLGFRLPRNPHKVQVFLALLRTGAAIRGRSVEALGSMPPMTDATLLTAMRILSCISSTAYVVRPNLFPLVVLKQVELSALHGNSQYSAFAYALYGCLHCAYLGRVKAGYGYGRLAVTLLARHEARELAPRTLFTFGSVVQHYVEPLAETLKSLHDAYMAAVDVGDLEFIAASAGTIVYASFFLGRPLPDVAPDLRSYADVTARLGQTAYNSYVRMFVQAVDSFRGNDGDPLLVTGAVFDSEAMLDRYTKEHDFHGVHNIHLLRLVAACLLCEPELGVRAAAAAEPHSFAVLGMVPALARHFYGALARIAAAGSCSGRRRSVLLSAVRKDMKELETLARFSPANHAHKLTLVLAEMKRIHGRSGEAEGLYDAAIDQAARSENLMDQALANELAARNYIASGKLKPARSYLRDAAFLYGKWGGFAKLHHMRDAYGELLHDLPVEQVHDSLVTVREEGGASPAKGTDLDSRIRVWQTLCGEAKLENVLEKTLSLVVELAGAQHGLLALENGDRISVEAETTTDRPGMAVLQHAPLSLRDDVAHSVVNYAIRSKEPVILHDAQTGMYSKDPHVQGAGVRSVLCLPLLMRTKLFGLVYLENNLSPGAFSSDRADELLGLVPELVRSMENALRMRDMEERVHALEHRSQDTGRRVLDLSERLERERLVSDALAASFLPRFAVAEFRKNLSVATRGYDSLTVAAVEISRHPAAPPPLTTGAGFADLAALIESTLGEHKCEKIGTGLTKLMFACGFTDTDEVNAGCLVECTLSLFGKLSQSGDSENPMWQIRAGIHTGPCSLTLVGGRARMFGWEGPAPERAARLAGWARHGELAVSAATAARLGDRFELRPAEAVRLGALGQEQVYFVEFRT